MDTFIFGNRPHFNIYFSGFNLSYSLPVLSEQSPRENNGGFDPMGDFSPAEAKDVIGSNPKDYIVDKNI